MVLYAVRFGQGLSSSSRSGSVRLGGRATVKSGRWWGYTRRARPRPVWPGLGGRPRLQAGRCVRRFFPVVSNAPPFPDSFTNPWPMSTYVGSGTRAHPGDVNKLYASARRTVGVINNNAMAIIGVIIIVVTVFHLTSWAPVGRGKPRHSPLLLGQIVVWFLFLFVHLINITPRQYRVWRRQSPPAVIS